ncbi:hypothetical protein FRC03_000215 [Tulasnella sp. 419]|nr:hypothetical protein FRC03_000215 [Tulasnella sp. 419]
MSQSLQVSHDASLDQLLDIIKCVKPLSTRPESNRLTLDILHAAYQHRQRNLLKHLWNSGALRTAIHQDVRPPTDADIKFEAIELALEQLRQKHAQLKIKAERGAKIEESKLLQEMKIRHKVAVAGSNVREHEYRNGPDQRTPRERARAVARQAPKSLLKHVLQRNSRPSYFDNRYGQWLAANRSSRRYLSWLSAQTEYKLAEYREFEKQRAAPAQAPASSSPGPEARLTSKRKQLEDTQLEGEAVISQVKDLISVTQCSDFTKDARSRRRIRFEDDDDGDDEKENPGQVSRTQPGSKSQKHKLPSHEDEPYGGARKRRAIGDNSVEYSVDTRLETEATPRKLTRSCSAEAQTHMAKISKIRTKGNKSPMPRKSSRARQIVGALFRLATVA